LEASREATNGGLLHGLGEAAQGAAGTAKGFGLSAAHTAGHGVVGGLSNVAQGGKFQDGFLSAAASAAVSNTGLANPETSKLNIVGRTAVASIAGGTASTLGGGKFANGAVTGAMHHLLNAEAGNIVDKLKESGGNIRGYFDRKRGIIGLSDETREDSIIRDGFLSGAGEGYTNNSDMQHIKSPDGHRGPAGPLPAGEYRIVYRSDGNGGNIYKKTGAPGYKLLALDSSPTDDSVYAGKGVTRSSFRLHKTYGIGCITSPNNSYNDIAKYIENSGRKNNSYGYITVY
jgi:hypothetical protein